MNEDVDWKLEVVKVEVARSDSQKSEVGKTTIRDSAIILPAIYTYFPRPDFDWVSDQNTCNINIVSLFCTNENQNNKCIIYIFITTDFC